MARDGSNRGHDGGRERREALDLALGYAVPDAPGHVNVLARALLALYDELQDVGQAAVREAARSTNFRKRYEEKERECALFADAINGYAEIYYAVRDGELTADEGLRAYQDHTESLGKPEAVHGL